VAYIIDRVATYVSQVVLVVTLATQAYLAASLSPADDFQPKCIINANFLSRVASLVMGTSVRSKESDEIPAEEWKKLKQIVTQLKKDVKGLQDRKATGLPGTAVRQALIYRLQQLETNFKTHLKVRWDTAIVC